MDDTVVNLRVVHSPSDEAVDGKLSYSAYTDSGSDEQKPMLHCYLSDNCPLILNYRHITEIVALSSHEFFIITEHVALCFRGQHLLRLVSELHSQTIAQIDCYDEDIFAPITGHRTSVITSTFLLTPKEARKRILADKGEKPTSDGFLSRLRALVLKR